MTSLCSGIVGADLKRVVALEAVRLYARERSGGVLPVAVLPALAGDTPLFQRYLVMRSGCWRVRGAITCCGNCKSEPDCSEHGVASHVLRFELLGMRFDPVDVTRVHAVFTVRPVLSVCLMLAVIADELELGSADGIFRSETTAFEYRGQARHSGP